MKDYILETKNLKESFGKEEVIKNGHLKVRRNSIYGLLGPNGACKSTLLKCFLV